MGSANAGGFGAVTASGPGIRQRRGPGRAEGMTQRDRSSGQPHALRPVVRYSHGSWGRIVSVRHRQPRPSVPDYWTCDRPTIQPKVDAFEEASDMWDMKAEKLPTIVSEISHHTVSLI